MKRFLFLISVFSLSNLIILPVLAGMTSSNFQINWDSLNEGGNEAVSSTNFFVRDTLGDFAAGTSTSANFQISAGYRVPEASDSMTLLIRSQNFNTSSTYTALNKSAKTVTLTSASGFSVGNYVAIVQGVGFSQLVAVGKVTAISGNTLTLDALDGASGTMSASPSGSNNYVSLLSESTIPFGSVAINTPNTGVTMTSVNSSVQTGYTVYLQANQQLQNGIGDLIANVTNGTVAVGTEGYGASATGTTAFVPDTDIAVTTTQRIIQSHAAVSVDPGDRIALSFKLSITGTTKGGSYSQNVFYTLTANY